MALVALLLTLACARTSVDRAQWQRMSRDEKTLYVRTLLGHEMVKERKGGNDLVFTRPAEEYVQRIDAAYASGDPRDVERVFESFGAKK